ncbi:GIY-YIG nuclease family protein [Brevibacillus dissolubilis]|uniref:GIY-YIG nuclease family protein n=1 Tax=Brevibacillus dissolubilis TaxID=1844116 RepID=UPI0011171207|nr:GIY-YIG nuclease family protein [Brevibacillus dissolubilis]
MEMQKRKQIKMDYKMTHRPTGVFQIKNLANGKIFLNTSTNLDLVYNRHLFQLKLGGHPNKELQADYNQFGAESFAFEVLEKVKPRDDVQDEYKAELKDMEAKWLEQLQPYGEKGYHKQKL